MNQLGQLVSPRLSFRVSFSYLKTVKDIGAWSNSRLKLKLHQLTPAGEVMVSQEEVQLFKTWLYL
jgi:hypothetical protein